MVAFVLLMLWAVQGQTISAQVVLQDGRQVSEQSVMEEFQLGSNPDNFSDNNGNSEEEISRVESSEEDREGNINFGRRVKMDDYELLVNRRTVLESGNVDLIVDLIDQEMEASKNWNKDEVIGEDIKDFPDLTDFTEFTLGERDLEQYFEMKKKIIFMETQMRKHKDQHVAIKPFGKNLKTIKTQFKTISDKLDSNVRDFIEDFFERTDMFLKEAQENFIGDNQDDPDDSIKTAQNIKEANVEFTQDNDRHFHHKFKYFWKKENEDLEAHLHSPDEPDSVLKSAISSSWFGRSVDVFAVTGLVIVLVILALAKWALRRKPTQSKVAKC